LLNIAVITFKVLFFFFFFLFFVLFPLGSYAPMSAPSRPFKTILKLVLSNGLQSSRRITPDVIVVKMPSVFPLSSGTQKRHWGLDPVNR
jgi:hypothetical protein